MRAHLRSCARFSQVGISANNQKAAKNRVLILNYIFYKLHQSMPRSVPSDLATSKQTEIFHREVYMGVSLDVGVHFYWANEIATAQAFVAVTGVDFDSADYKGAVFGIHASNADESKEDQATEMVKELSKFYWTPRWKYVVEYLRKRMYGKVVSMCTGVSPLQRCHPSQRLSTRIGTKTTR